MFLPIRVIVPSLGEKPVIKLLELTPKIYGCDFLCLERRLADAFISDTVCVVCLQRGIRLKLDRVISGFVGRRQLRVYGHRLTVYFQKRRRCQSHLGSAMLSLCNHQRFYPRD